MTTKTKAAKTPLETVTFVGRGRPIASGRTRYVSTCGRYCLVRASMIDGVPIERTKRGAPKIFWHACCKNDIWRGDLWNPLGRHKSRRSAERACCEHATRIRGIIADIERA